MFELRESTSTLFLICLNNVNFILFVYMAYDYRECIIAFQEIAHVSGVKLIPIWGYFKLKFNTKNQTHIYLDSFCGCRKAWGREKFLCYISCLPQWKAVGFIVPKWNKVWKCWNSPWEICLYPRDCAPQWRGSLLYLEKGSALLKFVSL